MNQCNTLSLELEFSDTLYVKFFEIYNESRNKLPDHSFNSFMAFYFRDYIKKCYYRGFAHTIEFKSEQKMTEFLLKWS